MRTPSTPGWYPDPTGERDKAFWDGSEWHDTVPASRKRFDPKAIKKLTAITGVTAMVGVALAAVIATLTRPDPSAGEGAGPAPAPARPAAPTTTPLQLTYKTMPKDGMYLVGGDQVDPGVWESDGPTDAVAGPCGWTRLSEARDVPENVIEAGGSDTGPARVRIRPTDAAFTTRGCQVWRLIAP